MRTTSLLVIALTGGLAFQVHAAEPSPLKLDFPTPNQVIQRVGFDPHAAGKSDSVSLASGHADVVIRGKLKKPEGILVWEYGVVLMVEGTGRASDWLPLDVRFQDDSFSATARVSAGGWYRIEVRAREQSAVQLQGSVGPIGVGEVIMVAGQSYATNCNDEKLKVADPKGRVVAYDWSKDSWSVAHDPQPVPDGSKDGSIWPPVGDALLKEFRVPIAFVNVAYGGTSSAQWLPEAELHQRLVKVGKTLGRFRCVVWQQGESDVIAKTATTKYAENIRRIRHTAADAWSWEPTWLLAKSTLHPTVYNDKEGEGRIRDGIDVLTKEQGFRPGPDTDKLDGENRGDSKSRRHFSSTGQRNAAEMWFGVLKAYLHAPQPLHEMLAAMKLLEPAWSSPVVHRESSILLKLKPDGPAVARLAFAASEILEVVSADRHHRYQVGRDVALSKDGLWLIFTNPQPIPVIAATDLFPPKDSPNSYRHRVGNPDQNLLYRPGRWFHDHNIEVTYRTKDHPAPLAFSGSLPKTLALLKAKKKLTIGVSGDSISTGLDASGMTKAYPFQPGYPDLVAAQLRATFRNEVILQNRAVGGWSVANGVTDLPKLLESKPDLIIVAYGMNDVGRKDPKWFGQRTREIVDRVRKELPETEIILVSSMLGNSEWVHTPRDMFVKYRDELKAITGEGVALGDVTAVWGLLLGIKHDLDLIGNGLNHPNDFGHRLYAQAILSLLGSK